MGGKQNFDFYADQTATIWAMLEPATHGIGTLAKEDATALIARQLGTVNSRRVSLAVGLWGEPGIGKTHAALTILERLSCHHLSLHATTANARIASALPRAKTLPTWANAQLDLLVRNESLETQTLAQTLAATLAASAPFVLHLEDVHEADAERLELIESLARALTRTRGVGLLATSRALLPQPFLNHRLEPLSRTEMVMLIDGELKGNAPRDGLDWVFERTRGNPLSSSHVTCDGRASCGRTANTGDGERRLRALYQ